MNLEKSDIKYSSVQNAADEASFLAQKNYLKFIKLQLTMLFLSTLTSIFVGYNRGLLFLVLFFMIVNFAISTIIKLRKSERVWYDGRAVAESIKTLSWRYMMKAEPFNLNDSEKDDEIRFIEIVDEVLDARRGLAFQIMDRSDNKDFVTDEMRTMRRLAHETRLKIYLEKRVNDQRKWYSKKSYYNRKWESILFYFSLIFQIVAIVYIILMVTFKQLDINLTAIFTSLVTLSVTWHQVKRHYELANAYGIAAQELMKIYSLGIKATDEQSFSEYVNDSENAISREHTLWTARRGQ
ncbi:DUF4231 domain-containing protein [Paenibacillus polymyxa]|uniref:DUF4231 domain-containing protein n=1 Tax=Paenibacillus polymyxa TaxID=1406 RepID=UPI0025B68849|nr:DUF4231 domain-containing protein [Paenibacillus polymyxa]MDN4086013.1 DUF4231 domain-containing protein [Paenibacillus polymyxa]MDN4108334.1 DUF4231 domain-containing protein [Paenibacillus polymyxa]